MIIQSMLDNDLYKFTMMQAVLHQFPYAEAEYKFKCRTEGVDFAPYVEKIKNEIDAMCANVRATKEELDYLGSLRFIKPDFVQFLKLFRFERDYVHVGLINDGGLAIAVKGPWLHTILFEVPILAIVSEVYSTAQSPNYKEANNRLVEKIETVKRLQQSNMPGFTFADFGTRRRYSRSWHADVVASFAAHLPVSFVGTSNVMLAKVFNLLPIGTMAHEWVQAHQALYRVADSQFMAFENWAKEYRGDLGIALSDTINLESFLCDFDMYFAKLFDGTRHDSGNPWEYACRVIDHYKSMGIDPLTKTIVFSDGLTMEKALELHADFSAKTNTSFGIGTHLTNDFDYSKVWPRHPLQIVMKMTKCNGQPVAKLSNSPGKTMCTDSRYLKYLEESFGRRVDQWKQGQK